MMSFKKQIILIGLLSFFATDTFANPILKSRKDSVINTFNKDFVGKLQVRERGFVTWFSKYQKIKMESI